MTRKHLPDILCSLLIFLLAFGLYTRTAAPGLVYEGGVSVDSAEIQRASYHLGILHSTGYPIYTVLAFIVSRIGEALGQSPYTAITYFSALCSALALVVFFRAARLIARLLPAVAVTLLLAVTSSYWWMSTIAEVQGFQALVFAGVLWGLIFYHQHPTQHKALYLAAWCTGLGLANHRLIMLALPACAFTVLIHYRHIRPRHLLILSLVGLLPLLSYAYIYLRASDPYALYNTRALWTPQELSVQDATNLIRGTFAGGTGLESNFELNVDALLNRLPTIWSNLLQDWHVVLIGVSILGLIAMLRVNVRIALTLMLIALPVVPFLLIWKVDVKPIIYQYALWFPLAMGLAALLSLDWLPKKLFEPQNSQEIEPQRRKDRKAQAQIAASVLSSTLILFVTFQYLNANYSDRDMSDDHRSEAFAQAINALPSDAMFLTVQWSPEIFIALDTLERHGRQMLVYNTDVWQSTFSNIYNTAQSVYVGEYWRARMGLYDGATWFAQENLIAYSGTTSEFLLQVRPADDPRLQAEANTATLVNQPINAEVSLYSYLVEPVEGGWWITLYWRAEAVPSESLSVYTHLRFYETMCQFDNGVRLLGQDDSNAPVASSYPTTLWSAGQIVKDTYFIATPAEALDNTHTAFAFGMTSPTTGERLNEFCLPIEDVDN